MAATRALALVVVLATIAQADVSDETILGDRDWRVEQVELRTTYLVQRGHGYQSQAGEDGEPGSEEMWMLAPVARFRIRQNEQVVHHVTLPVDVITAASPDAVDATSSASRRNEAFEVDVRSAIERTEVDTITTRVTAHVEENLRSGTVGAGWRRSLADDNATVALSTNATFDYFEDRDQFGNRLGKAKRATLNANLAVSQLLSPTTVVDGSYGITHQRGDLSNGWNAVPVGMYRPTYELLPGSRTRHALAGRLSQHVPQTRSTVKLWYRYYQDDFEIRAYTVRLDAFQYLVPWVYVRGGYRFHRQDAAAFFTTDHGLGRFHVLRTADSDLAAFDAHEWSVQLVTLQDVWTVSAEVLRYMRTNDLAITALSFGLGRVL